MIYSVNRVATLQLVSQEMKPFAKGILSAPFGRGSSAPLRSKCKFQSKTAISFKGNLKLFASWLGLYTYTSPHTPCGGNGESPTGSRGSSDCVFDNISNSSDNSNNISDYISLYTYIPVCISVCSMIFLCSYISISVSLIIIIPLIISLYMTVYITQ